MILSLQNLFYWIQPNGDSFQIRCWWILQKTWTKATFPSGLAYESKHPERGSCLWVEIPSIPVETERPKNLIGYSLKVLPFISIQQRMAHPYDRTLPLGGFESNLSIVSVVGRLKTSPINEMNVENDFPTVFRFRFLKSHVPCGQARSSSSIRWWCHEECS